MSDHKDDLAPDYIWAAREAGSDDMDAGTFCAVDDGGTKYIRDDLAQSIWWDGYAAGAYKSKKAVEEIEELRDCLMQDVEFCRMMAKTFQILSVEEEEWKARARAAEAKANVMVADKINLRSELLSVKAKLAKAAEVIQDAYFEGYNSAQKIHDPFSPAYAWEKSKALAALAEIGGEKP